MDAAEYDKLDQLEEQMWWFAAMHANLIMMARWVGMYAAPSRILDAGCGTGGLLVKLAAQRAGTVFGLEVNEMACARARTKAASPVCQGSVNALPFLDETFSMIFSADVLCHRGVDEQRALTQFHRCLVHGGTLVLNLPAYRWMLSRHDIAVHNVRRYTCRGAVQLLRNSGFRVVFASYWNTFLFPLMLINRKLLPARSMTSDVRLHSAPVESLCRAVTALERFLLSGGLRFPFGGSVIAIGRKLG